MRQEYLLTLKAIEPRFLGRPEDSNKYPVKVKVKLNFTLEQATKALRGSRGIALLFLS